MHTIVEGFYAVEQYVPDYVRTLLRVIRTSYGRSHFHIRWGAEEERHAELWRNVVLSMGRRTPEWLEDYTDLLRERSFALPWDDALHMVFYTLFQERATEVNYLNLAAAAEGTPRLPVLANAVDPVLAKACRTIARDEAAHYHFFLEAARLFLYYYPEDAVAAMVDVLRHFSMPARDIIPDYDTFGAVLHRTGVFTRRIHYQDVAQVALGHLGVRNLRAVEAGVRASRTVPGPDGVERGTAIFESINPELLDASVRRLFARIERYAREAGVEHTMRIEFRPNRGYAIPHGPRSPTSRPLDRERLPANPALATESRLRTALDRCDSLLSPRRAGEAVMQLVNDLAEIRATMPLGVWRAEVEAHRRHPLHARLCQDPYIQAALRKPRGYAGDAETLDYVYQQVYDGKLTALGHELFRVSTGAAIADAVRSRCAYLGAAIQGTVEHRGLATVVSVACGHLRELHHIPGEVLGQAQVVGLDHDERTITRLAALHPAARLLPVRASVKEILQRRVALPPADLCYAAGLYDYLDERLATALTARLVAGLRPDGELLITNLTPANPEIAFMEVVMDWWMVYRDEHALGALVQAVAAEQAGLSYQTCSFDSGRVAAAVIRQERRAA
ncbi:MAG TPA: acyl-ACP desaturase [Gemmatimonadales bacterium]